MTIASKVFLQCVPDERAAGVLDKGVVHAWERCERPHSSLTGLGYYVKNGTGVAEMTTGGVGIFPHLLNPFCSLTRGE